MNRHRKILLEMLGGLPGVYYYLSRYEFAYERWLHILKFWGAYYLLSLLVVPECSVRVHLLLFLSWMAFLNIYDYFSRENDELSVSKEKSGILRDTELKPTARVNILMKLSILVVLECAILLIDIRAAISTSVLLGATGVIFAVHNRIDLVWRPLSHLLLYVCKGSLFISVLMHEIGASSIVPLWALTAVLSISYTPCYLLRKWADAGVIKVNRAKGCRRLGSLARPIYFKNMFLLALCGRFPALLGVLVWIDLFTLAEVCFAMKTGWPRRLRDIIPNQDST